MSSTSLTHSTVEHTRTLRAAPGAVFAAYVDVEQRARWTAPEGHEVVYDDAEFAVGGVDTYRCGPLGKADLAGRVHYLEIAENARIVYSETILLGDGPLAISLVTWELGEGEDAGETVLSVVSQVCSFVGDDMVEGTREGLSMALDNLERALRELEGDREAG